MNYPVTSLTNTPSALNGDVVTHSQSEYHQIVTQSANEPVRVYSVGPLSYLSRTVPPEHIVNTIQEVTRSLIGGMGCRTCIQRAQSLGFLQGPSGHCLLYHMDSSTCMNKALVEVKEIAKEATTQDYLAVPLVLDENTIPSLMSGGFEHWTIKPESVSDQSRAALFKRAADTDYVDMENGTMLTGLVAKLLCNKEMSDSMNLFDECLKKTSRGATLYRGTTNWMLAIQKYAIDSFGGRFWHNLTNLEKLNAVMYALGTSNLTKGDKDATACPNYHQANGTILGFLENAYGVDAMVALVNAQSDPTAYQRRTAELTEGQLNVGAALLGPFKNTIALKSDLPKLYPDQTITWSTGSAGPAGSVGPTYTDESVSSEYGFDALRVSIKNKKANDALSEKTKNASGFASRSGVTVPTTIRKIETVTDLISVLSDGKPHLMTIDATGHSPWIVANTTLDTKKLRSLQKHMWGLYHGVDAKSWGGTQTMKVNTIFKMPMGELFFLCEGLQLPSGMGNFNFPEFLAPHMHSAKATFEALNKTTTLERPSIVGDDFYAIGVCASPQTSARTLAKPVTIVLDGVSQTLVRYG
jgi:hypothetical protein